ncbi:MAG TPA: putative sugar nucleotidyl transferase [Gemmatimonadaceae bacterium]|nr:putative sugar nucleotidyl transferase [Gemmatimonadaceae bacterium]
MTTLYLVDDDAARDFMPFALTRPAAELRAGAMLLRERWERAFGTRASGLLVAPHLADFHEAGAPPVAHDALPAGAVLANARCAVALDAVAGDADVWMCEGRVAAVRLGRSVTIEAVEHERLTIERMPAGGSRVATVSGRWIDAVWDFVATLGAQLTEDVARLGPRIHRVAPAGGSVLGSHEVYVERGATVEPFVVFDATTGPILVRSGATLRAFTRLAGPCVIDGGTTILGDRVSGCSIGGGCMIRGEISDTIVTGNANKAHEGFVGHSVLGRWVNLGAGTTTSNLKNTYGSVSLATPSGLRDTGQLKLGAFFGDHAKTGIGLCLTTGTVIGAGSNVYGAAMPSKEVPPFSWGEATQLRPYQLEKFLQTAERAMGRRGITLSDTARRQLSAAHALAHPEP